MKLLKLISEIKQLGSKKLIAKDTGKPTEDGPVFKLIIPEIPEIYYTPEDVEFGVSSSLSTSNVMSLRKIIQFLDDNNIIYNKNVIKHSGWYHFNISQEYFEVI